MKPNLSVLFAQGDLVRNIMLKVRFLCFLSWSCRTFLCFSDHMKSHYNVKDWICNDCGKGFTTDHVLKRHLKVCKKRKGRSGETDETNQPNPTEQYPSYETPPRAPWSALRTSNEATDWINVRSTTVLYYFVVKWTVHICIIMYHKHPTSCR